MIGPPGINLISSNPNGMVYGCGSLLWRKQDPFNALRAQFGQLLLDGAAYYTESEWSGGSHFLKDHRPLIGSSRNRQPGRATRVHATTVYANGPDIGDGTAVTLAFRVKTTDANNRWLISKVGGVWQWGIILASGQLSFTQYTTTASTYRTVTTVGHDFSEWTDVVVSFTDAATSVSINGDTYVTEASSGTWATSGGEFRVGDGLGGIAAAIISIRDLIVAESDLWSQRATIFDSPGDALVHYPMEEGGGIISYNRLADENHLTWWNSTLGSLHVVDSTVAKSWADDEGFTPAFRVRSDDLLPVYTADNHWLSSKTVSGDFRVDAYLETSNVSAIFGLQRDAVLNATDPYKQIIYGVSRRTGGLTDVWVGNTTGIQLDVPMPAFAVVSFRRVDGTISLYVNDELAYTYPTATTDALYAAASFGNSPPPVIFAYLNGEEFGSSLIGAGIDVETLALPRISGSAVDRAGNFPYTGKSHSPGLYLPPVLTGNATDVCVDIPDLSLTAADGLDVTFRVKRNTSVAPTDGEYLLDVATGPLILAISSLVSFEVGYYDGSWHNFGVAPADTDWHKLRFIFDGVGTAEVYLDDELLGSDSYTPAALSGASSLLSNNLTTDHFANVQLGCVEISKYDGTPVRWYVPDGATRNVYDAVSGDTGTIVGGVVETIFANRGDGSWQDVRVLYGGRIDGTVMIPSLTDGTAYSDGVAFDAESVSHVPANRFADPQAAVDRTGGSPNSVFAYQSGAPTAELVGDVGTTKVRKRTVNSYVDRLGTGVEAIDATYFSG